MARPPTQAQIALRGARRSSPAATRAWGPSAFAREGAQRRDQLSSGRGARRTRRSRSARSGRIENWAASRRHSRRTPSWQFVDRVNHHRSRWWDIKKRRTKGRVEIHGGVHERRRASRLGRDETQGKNRGTWRIADANGFVGAHGAHIELRRSSRCAGSLCKLDVNGEWRASSQLSSFSIRMGRSRMRLPVA